MGATIARLRKERHLSQAALAKKAGISTTKLAEIEIGIKIATPEDIKAIATALEVDVQDLRYRANKYRI